MNRFYTYILFSLLALSSTAILVSCNKWDLPTRKSKRDCAAPEGNLEAQLQQRKVDFSLSKSTGTIDQVLWDFGNNSTTATTGTTVSYTYPTSGTYVVTATMTNTCTDVVKLSRTIVVSDAVRPTVTLQAITTVANTSALVGMTITSTGNATITGYGVCYSTTNPTPDITTDPKIEGSLPASVNSSIPFSLTGLQPNTLYYVRSYAINSAGIMYSTVQQFTTGQSPSVTNNGVATASVTTATVNFIITNPGTPAAVEYGICYSTTNTTPDITSSILVVASPPLGVNIAVNLSNLTANKTYYYRPYAKVASGPPAYGDVMTFTTQLDAVAQDLIASVSFNDRSLLDISGYNNHVRLVDNATFTTDHKGNPNSAVLLDGSGDYFYMPYNASLEPDAISISIWIKPITLDRRMQVYNKSRFSDGAFEMYSSLLKLEGDIGPNITILTDIKQNGGCQGGVGWQSFPITNRIQLNTWHHLVFTYVGRSARMYFDGSLQYSVDNLPASAIDKCSGGDLKFGAQVQALPWYFYGAMDDIRIYKRAITAAEVQTLFNQ